MYIKSAEITNIRSIKKFKMRFDKPAGWHVLIGDNGSGKTTIIQAISLILIEREAKWVFLLENSGSWVNQEAEEGKIYLIRDDISNELTITNNEGEGGEVSWSKPPSKATGFSAAYGPYRRFTGGNSKWEEISKQFTRLSAHLSAFGEETALTEVIEWLKQLNYQRLEQLEAQKLPSNAEYTLDNLSKLINSADFLPHQAKLEKISSKGVFFRDGNGSLIEINEMSDGYRSMLSLTFELIRQLILFYGEAEVFKQIKKGVMEIDLPGVVLIHEIDAHLHPTWQTRVGQWFTQYFPRLQFIVTTHSPLVCRACENGTIWRLAAPGSDTPSAEITGTDKQKLIYGNILDAYGTEIFGESPVRSEKSAEKLALLGRLNIKAALGKISADEEQERIELQQILSTDAPTGF